MSEFYYFFYKSVSQFFMPLGIFFITVALSFIFLVVRKKKTALMLVIFSVLWLWFWSMPLWNDYIRFTLESKFAFRPAQEYPRADAIVVLGGGVRGYAGPSLPVIDLNRAADRELFAAQLYHAGRSNMVILSGGADPIQRTGSSAMGMKIFLINLGVPAAAIRIDAQSRNTRENLQEVVKMLRMSGGKTILLVTSAMHMHRASWLFSKSGLKVIPAPADFEVVKVPFSIYRLLPDAEALENSSRAAREIIGLWSYRLGFH
jgi:uncharacterized SAM-binding protein YcdF (DUF218 family)